MNDPKLGEVRSWLQKALQDLSAAAWLLESPQSLYGIVGFHCQQAAEKVLKAYLTFEEEPFGKTHSLVALVGMGLKYNVEFESLRIAATTLTPYAVATRYPGDMIDISVQEAKAALSLAYQVWDFVLSCLPEEVRS